MAQPTLDYRTPQRETRLRRAPALPWYRSDLATAGFTVLVILTFNAWLISIAGNGWGVWMWTLIAIPVANGVLAAVLLACTPIVRRVSGMSASLHVWVTLVGCVLAVFADTAIIYASPGAS